MGSCFSKRKRSDAAVIHNASPRTSRDFASVELVAMIKGDSPNLLPASKVDVAKEENPLSSNSRNASSLQEELPKAHEPQLVALKIQAAHFLGSSPAAAGSCTSAEDLPQCTPPSRVEMNRVLFLQENGSGELHSAEIPTSIFAARAIPNVNPAAVTPESSLEFLHPDASQHEVSSPMSVILNQETKESAHPSTTTKIRGGPITELENPAVDTPNAPVQSSNRVFGDLVKGIDEPPDGFGSIHPSPVDSNLETVVLESRRATVDVAQSFSGLKLQVRSKHMLSEAAEVASTSDSAAGKNCGPETPLQESVDRKPALKLKRSRSFEHFMDSGAKRLLRRRSLNPSFVVSVASETPDTMGGSSFSGDADLIPGSTVQSSEVDDQQRTLDVLVGQDEQITNSEMLRESGKIEQQMSLVLEGLRIVKLYETAESERGEEEEQLSSIGVVCGERGQEDVGEEVNKGKKITNDLDSKKAVNLESQPCCEHEENRLSVELFELLNRDLSMAFPGTDNEPRESKKGGRRMDEQDNTMKSEEQQVTLPPHSQIFSMGDPDMLTVSCNEDEFQDIIIGGCLAGFAVVGEELSDVQTKKVGEQRPTESQEDLLIASQAKYCITFEALPSCVAENGNHDSFSFMHSRASSVDAALPEASSNGIFLETRKDSVSSPRDSSFTDDRSEEDCESDSETFEFKQAVSVFSKENMQYLGQKEFVTTVSTAGMGGDRTVPVAPSEYTSADKRRALIGYSSKKSSPLKRGRATFTYETGSMIDLSLPKDSLAAIRTMGGDRERRERESHMQHRFEDMDRLQELSVVSTGDAVLFSGSNSEELHLIPSKSYVLDMPCPINPKMSQLSREDSSISRSPHRGEYLQQEQSALSIDDIILLLENDELDEEDLLSFLINAKTSCPTSDVASESSFEFKVKSAGSTPHSTPSTPMLSAGSTPRRISQLKPIALTPEEIAEIWGVFEQRQSLAS